MTKPENIKIKSICDFQGRHVYKELWGLEMPLEAMTDIEGYTPALDNEHILIYTKSTVILATMLSQKK